MEDLLNNLLFSIFIVLAFISFVLGAIAYGIAWLATSIMKRWGHSSSQK